ncbi:MAG: hypothetical protein QY332_16800 [Anaerolineales bacterium]|nr:MAG: hypothetical protein QY332_16800 [Anaerolineales bacterium]
MRRLLLLLTVIDMLLLVLGGYACSRKLKFLSLRLDQVTDDMLKRG